MKKTKKIVLSFNHKAKRIQGAFLVNGKQALPDDLKELGGYEKEAIDMLERINKKATTLSLLKEIDNSDRKTKDKILIVFMLGFIMVQQSDHYASIIAARMLDKNNKKLSNVAESAYENMKKDDDIKEVAHLATVQVLGSCFYLNKNKTALYSAILDAITGRPDQHKENKG
jgi:hypothetical protein